jgi:3-methyladenine DNA glycosylase AlkC
VFSCLFDSKPNEQKSTFNRKSVQSIVNNVMKIGSSISLLGAKNWGLMKKLQMMGYIASGELAKLGDAGKTGAVAAC